MGDEAYNWYLCSLAIKVNWCVVLNRDVNCAVSCSVGIVHRLAMRRTFRHRAMHSIYLS